MRKPFAVDLYLVADRAVCGGRPVEEVVTAALRGGASAVQLRDKQASTRELLALALRLGNIARHVGALFLVNDRVDVAWACGADGVHLGQSDLPAREARRLLGPKAFIGLSVESLEDLARSEAEDVDYYGVSPVFPTPTKPELKTAWGLEGLRNARARTTRPLIAIGGITAENAGAVVEAGADGVAVVSAICAAPDPEGAARALKRAVQEGKARTGRKPSS